MICVSIGRSRHKMMIAEHQALASRGAQLVELRVDWLASTPDFSRLLTNRPTPVVVTCRRASDKGEWKGTEEQRQLALKQAIIAGADYVDIEEDIAPSIRRYGKTKRIISYHNFEETPIDLDEISDRMCRSDPDILKIVTMGNAPSDGVKLLQLMAKSKVPMIAFCMGEFGVFSRILAGKFGAPFTYATFNKARALAPGQLAFDDMVSLYRYDSINPETEFYGVVADPVAHSLSPLIHNKAFEKLGMNKVYVPFRITPETFTFTMDNLRRLGLRGASVTLPHKEAAVKLAKELDYPVSDVGACNTLYLGSDQEGTGNKTWRAANTDYQAALDCLRLGLERKGESYSSNELMFLAGKKVLILGAGGVARAMGLGVVRSGGLLTISNRAADRGNELAKHLGCQRVQWDQRASVYADIIVNCTSVGMHPGVDSSPFEENWFREGQVVFDTVYNPETTLLLKKAKLRSCIPVSGIEMFVRQAASQFHLFTGNEAPLDLFREVLRMAISPITQRS